MKEEDAGRMFYRSYSCLLVVKPIGIIRSNTNAILPESSAADQMQSIGLTEVFALPLGIADRTQCCPWVLKFCIGSLVIN